MCLEGLAGVAAAREDHELAAELHGARDAIAAQVGLALPPIHPGGYTRTLTAIQTALTPATIETARATGRARPLDHTIARAVTER